MSSPGRSYRKGISLIELMEMFPDEQSAADWFESIFWPNGRCCGHCGGTRTSETPHGRPQPYWCTDCRHYFSVRTGTVLACSKIPLRKWAFGIYLCMTNLKSISALHLRRELKISARASWFMMHRIREAWMLETSGMFTGPIEADEAYFGGRYKSMHRKERKQGRARTNKTEVVGVKDRTTKQVRATVIRRRDEDPDGLTPMEFVIEHTAPGATVYTDEAQGYRQLPNRVFVTHGVGEYVRGMAHINSMESFWSMLKRAYVGTFHKLSAKHLNRYVQEFVAKHNIRDADTIDQMRDTVARFVGCRLLYRDLIADNGLPSGARPVSSRIRSDTED